MTPKCHPTSNGRIGRAALAGVFVIFSAGNLAAQVTEVIDGLKINRSQGTGRASFVTAADGGAIAVRAAAGTAVAKPIDFFHQHGGLFGVSEPAAQLVFDKAEVGLLGQMHTTFRQMHRGIPVFAGILKVHQSGNGDFRAANGEFFPIPDDLQTVPTIQTQAAVDVALEALAQGQPAVVRSDLLIVDPGWYGDPAIGAHLAYHIVLKDAAAGIMEAFFVDAHTGAILDRWSMIHTGRFRKIHNAAGGSSLPGTLARLEDEPPTGVADVDAAYDYLGDTYDYFSRAFGRDGINDANLPLVATVNLGLSNCPNAFWNGSQMAFCPGLVTDDVVGHEYMHGVTQFTAGLIYQNQSGQLNESYSDVFGELVDLFNGDAAFAGIPGGTPAWPTHPTGPGLDTPNNARTMCSNFGLNGPYPDGVRWLIGEDASPPFLDAIRDMWDPTCKGHPPHPDRANSEFQTCGGPDGLDNGGVHSGSGIPNHAFAMLTDGKTFNGFTVNGIGPIKSGAVWYRALTVYLTDASDFRAAFIALNRAADDLIGTFPNDPRDGLPSSSMFTAFDAQEVDNALLAVEMNTRGRCGGGAPPPPPPDRVLLPDPPPTCPNPVTIFADDFESGANGWTVRISGPAVPADWALLGEPLPVERPGTVWFVRNKADGVCAQADESATHSLFSPPIDMPANMDHPLMSFAHHMKCQPGWDGGNIRIRVNGGPWNAVPRTAIVFNPYNARLNSAPGSSNPAAGQDAWSGEGLGWGTSVVDLASPDLAAPLNAGDMLEVRFDFNTNCDGGLEGWYVDDFAVYTCPDCDNDGVSDDREFLYSASSPTFAPLVGGQTETFVIIDPPMAASGTNVALFIVASGDFNPHPQAVQVKLRNGPPGEFVFISGATGCPATNSLTPDSEILLIPALDFNIRASFGIVVFDLTPVNIGAGTCGGESFLNVSIKYETQVVDCDDNMILDSCQTDCNGNGTADACELDTDGDGVIDDCDVCPGGNDLSDADGDGVPDACDLCAGANDALDSDGDSVPDCLDNCPNVSNADQADSAGDGTGDACRDCNGNGVVDLVDLANGTSQDCNGDMLSDECDPKPVEAHAGADVTIGEGQSIRLGDRPAAVGTTPPYAYRWTLPDNPGGQVSTLANPAYGPLPPGAHVAMLVVTGSTGCTATASVIVTVDAAPPPLPVADNPTAMPANNPCGGLFGPPAALMLTVMIIGQRRTRCRRRRLP